jgi:GNAT superfamily N-acetyltransferase
MFRDQVHHSDRSKIFNLFSHSGQFSPREISYAMALFDSHTQYGNDSVNHFILQEKDHDLHSCACYGPMPLSENRFQLYWLAIDHHHRKAGLSKTIEQVIEDKVRHLGGVKIFIEASSLPRHESLRHFHESCGYRLVAVVPDYYAQGDHKVWLAKDL